VKDMVHGTTPPGEDGDAIILAVQERFPNAKAVLVLTGDETGLTVHTMTSLAAPSLVGALAEYVHEIATELGMP
jgi:hypothetical protein